MSSHNWLSTKRILGRAPSLGSKSFGRCFRPPQIEACYNRLEAYVGEDTQIDACYNRLENHVGEEDTQSEIMAEEEKEEQAIINEEEESKPARRRLRRSSSLITLRESQRPGFTSKVKEACGQVLDAAKKSSPHVNHLFAGNHLLMQVTPAWPSTNKIKAAPSSGFIGTRPIGRAPHDVSRWKGL